MVRSRALDGLLHRAKLRAPGLLARVSGELPLRSAAHLYTPAPPCGHAIPNIVRQSWRDAMVGRRHLAALTAFRTRNPDYAFVLSDEAAIDDYMARRWGDHPIGTIFQRGRFGPLRTDIWRYCVLFDQGGIYCDIGKALDRPLREILPPDATAVIAYERNPTDHPANGSVAEHLQHPDLRVINWAMAFAPGHPLLGRVIDRIVADYPAYRGRVVSDCKRAILDFTGPEQLTRALHDHAQQHGLDDVHQAGVDFGGTAQIELPGSYVRYTRQRSYSTARNQPIVD